MTEDGEGCFFNTENKRVADSIADAFDSVGKEYSTGESTFRGRTLYTVTLADKSGLQIMALGIVGEYIGKIYIEVKARPKYIIDKFINKQ